MFNNELLTALPGIQSSSNLDEGGEWFTVYTNDWLNLARKLRKHPDLLFDYLFCLTCIDWKTHLTMVYHLSSTIHRHNIVVKSNLDRSNPEIESVTHIWKTAEFHEREVYELFGVKFLNHLDLRKLILPDDWEGYPLRKDYDDPVNMIKL
jgi:NADH:ubiquinone oxidoreductase subunit C